MQLNIKMHAGVFHSIRGAWTAWLYVFPLTLRCALARPDSCQNTPVLWPPGSLQPDLSRFYPPVCTKSNCVCSSGRRGWWLLVRSGLNNTVHPQGGLYNAADIPPQILLYLLLCATRCTHSLVQCVFEPRRPRCVNINDSVIVRRSAARAGKGTQLLFSCCY